LTPTDHPRKLLLTFYLLSPKIRYMEFSPCRYRTAPDADNVPVILTDGVDPELPCDKLAGYVKPVSLVVTPVPARGCLCQRGAGLCPRGLGEDVDPTLALNALNGSSHH